MCKSFLSLCFLRFLLFNVRKLERLAEKQSGICSVLDRVSYEVANYVVRITDDHRRPKR